MQKNAFKIYRLLELRHARLKLFEGDTITTEHVYTRFSKHEIELRLRVRAPTDSGYDQSNAAEYFKKEGCDRIYHVGFDNIIDWDVTHDQPCPPRRVDDDDKFIADATKRMNEMVNELMDKTNVQIELIKHQEKKIKELESKNSDEPCVVHIDPNKCYKFVHT